MAAVQLVVGLGNPGSEYDQTRHNAGALSVGRLAHAQGVSLVADHEYFDLVGKLSHQGKDVHLLIPTTYMNHSSQSMAALMRFFRVIPGAILVAHGELDMPSGVAKFKTSSGHGGHSGLRDAITQLGNQDSFHRPRLGIGHPGYSSLVSDYMLSRASRSEQELLDISIDFALGMLPEMLTRDQTRTTQRLRNQEA